MLMRILECFIINLTTSAYDQFFRLDLFTVFLWKEFYELGNEFHCRRCMSFAYHTRLGRLIDGGV